MYRGLWGIYSYYSALRHRESEKDTPNMCALGNVTLCLPLGEGVLEHDR